MLKEKHLRFADGKSKAMTFSYDDGVVCDRRLMSVFDKYGAKSTFNINSGLFDDRGTHNRMTEKETLDTFLACGHEIALHGDKHIFLDRVTLAEAMSEIIDCKKYLEGTFGNIASGMAYAYGAYNTDVERMLSMAGILYSRTTHSTHSFALPDNWLEWHPTCHHNDESLMTYADRFVNAQPNQEFKHRQPLLMYVWGHSYEFDDNDNWSTIEDFCQYVCARDDIWYATNISIYRYIAAYNRLVFSADGNMAYNVSDIDLWIDYQGKTYRLPSGSTTNISE